MAEGWRTRPELAPAEVILPVPLHFLRRQWRGYNQSALLATFFGKSVGLPVVEGVLSRRRWGRSQTRLSREERKKNVEKAFVVRRPEGVKGRRVLLIDDVCTTGATLDACAQVVRAAGARWVAAFTVARRV
jgi:ComF family protein